MFFTLHPERKIGYKKLSEADLGLGETSHQTHIGLYEKKGMLSFLKNEDTTNAILIYNNYCDILPCDFDRIENPDGSFRSPKIRLGAADENTIVRKIREFAAQNPNRNYYLIWFGLDDNVLLFWLLDNASSDYDKIHSFFPSEDTVYDETQINFTSVISFIENKIDELSINLQEDLEIVSQTLNISDRYKSFDIEKAQKRYKETGRSGEELINIYLEKQKSENQISSFEWVNRSRESGKPFDFIVYSTIDDECYVDVKSTQFKFEQPLLFSDNEIDFIKTLPESRYSVYRVYALRDEFKKFRKCCQCFDYMYDLNQKIIIFDNEIQKVSAKLRGIKIAVEPTEKAFKQISADIQL
jgi:hypothetical protein